MFLSALEEAGVRLTEPDEIEVRTPLNFPRLPDKPWEVHEEIDEEEVAGERADSKSAPVPRKDKKLKV